jgi:hypothetical protein
MNIIKKKYSELRDIRTVAILADPACRSCWGKNTPPLLEHVWRTHRPELFLVAGDLAIHGTSREHLAFISAVRRYPALLAAVPGDHDRPLKSFMSHFGSTRKVIDVGKWRFIGVNTANRMFPKSEADFLENHIRRNTLIFTHVPPGVNGWTFHGFPPYYSGRILSIIDRHASEITAAFFGHIHGYSRRKYSGVPLVATGGTAESFTVRNNRYDGPGFSQMMIFDTATGKLTLCKMAA